MKIKTALTELRKLVPRRYGIVAEVRQVEIDGNLRPAICEIKVFSGCSMMAQFPGNCLEPCLQDASAWAAKKFGGSR